MVGPSAMIPAGSFKQIAFRDLDFTRVPVVARSSRGTPYTRWVPVGMPRIPSHILDTVFYLYESEEKAKQGREFGGTGFLVSFPTRFPDRIFVYAVTNHHVACTGGASVARVNTKDGGTDIFPFEPDEWHCDPRYDIAVCEIGMDWSVHQASLVPISAFITKEKIEGEGIGVGDDVFMVGRFLDHDGGVSNRPAARFGNISVMPSPIEQPNGMLADAYCIDLHSRSGYSGSPVFVYKMGSTDLADPPPNTNGPSP